MKQRIVLLGPPASGKGTQADRLSDTFGIPHVSTGALLRAECSLGTSFGREADSWTSKGLLIPDDLAIRIIHSWIAEHGTSFLFDGFPRSIDQAEHLDEELAALHAPLDLILLLELGDDEVHRRIFDRLSCLHCGATYAGTLHGYVEGMRCPRCEAVLIRRNDDTAEALERRMTVYRELTEPVVGYYERTVPNLLHRLDAGQGSDAVFATISRLVSQNTRR